MQTTNNSAFGQRWQLLCWLGLVIAITSFHLLYVYKDVWPLNGDEAQYWSWSQHLAFGYYSKPPFLAWLIAATTHLLGDNLIGLRIGTTACHVVTSIFIYLSAKKLYDHRVAFWSSISYLLLPGVSFSTSIISTDPPLLSFWAISFYIFLHAIEEDRLTGWFALGVVMGLGLLSKYIAVFFPVSAFIYLLITSQKRYLLRHAGFYWSIGIAACMLLPNIIWNAQHHFVSFQAVNENANLQGHFFHISNLFFFLASQLALLGPIFFLFMMYLLLKQQRVIGKEKQGLLLVFVWPLFVLMLVEAFLTRAHGNWAVPIYITGLIAICAYLVKTEKIKWLIAACLINVLVFIGLFQAPTLIQRVHLKLPLHTAILNWPATGNEIAKQKQKYPQSLLLVDSRMLLTLSMYYSKIPLEQVFEWNPLNEIHDQYQMRASLSQEQGRDFLLVTYQPNPWFITLFFNTSRFLATLPQLGLDGRATKVYLFYLQDFLGYCPYCVQTFFSEQIFLNKLNFWEPKLGFRQLQ
jgi:4-amino-4-deoxy-L-arabinose transferase-like glycosyltransferase